MVRTAERCGLFPNSRLFLKVDEAEWVIFKYQRQSRDIAGEDVELMDTRQTQTKKPDLRLDLLRFGCRGKSGRATCCARVGLGDSAVCSGTADGGSIDREDVCRAVVEAVMVVKVQLHSAQAVMAVKVESSRATVFESGLRPRGKYIT